MDATSDRLGVVDGMFLRSHQGLGTPVAMQGLWRTDEAIALDVLGDLHGTLRDGPLGRRVVHTRIPGARPWWRANTRAHPLHIETGALPASRILEWADRQATDLDPEDGTGWRLSATGVDDGGTVVSLTCSHALADARGLALAVGQALQGSSAAPHPEHISDFADARRTWSTVLTGTARALGGLVAHPGRMQELRQPHTTRAWRPYEPAAVYVPPTLVLQFPCAPWDSVADQQGGTSNSLFIAIVTGILRRADPELSERPLDVSLPIETRSTEVGGNAMSMSEVVVSPDESLATIRRNCRTAYSTRMTSPGGFPEELLQVVPGRLAHAMSKGSGERDVLCSNIGGLPAALTTIGGHPTSGIATRALHPGLTTGQLGELRTRLSGYLCRIGDQYTLSLVALDPASIESSSALRDLANAEIQSWGLSARGW